MTNKGRVSSMDILDKWMAHAPGGTEWDGMRVPNATQNDTQFKAQELSISANFLLIFLDHVDCR